MTKSASVLAGGDGIGSLGTFANRVGEALGSLRQQRQAELKLQRANERSLHAALTSKLDLTTAKPEHIAKAFVVKPDVDKLEALWGKSTTTNPDDFWTLINKAFDGHGAKQGQGYQNSQKEHGQAFASFYDKLGAESLLTSLQPLATRGNEWWVNSNKLFQWGYYAADSSIAKALLEELPKNLTSNSQASYFLAGLVAGLANNGKLSGNISQPGNDFIATLSKTHPDSISWTIESLLHAEFTATGSIAEQGFLKLTNKLDAYHLHHLLNRLVNEGQTRESKTKNFSEALRELIFKMASSNPDLQLRGKFVAMAASNYFDNKLAVRVLDHMLSDPDATKIWDWAEAANYRLNQLTQERHSQQNVSSTSLAGCFGIALRGSFKAKSERRPPDELLFAAYLAKNPKDNVTSHLLRNIDPIKSVEPLKERSKQVAALHWLNNVITAAV